MSISNVRTEEGKRQVALRSTAELLHNFGIEPGLARISGKTAARQGKRNYIAFKDLTLHQLYAKWSEVIRVWKEKQDRERVRVDHDRGGDPEEAARLSRSFETDEAIFNTLKDRFAKLDVETGHDKQAARLEKEKVKQERIARVAPNTGRATKKQFPISRVREKSSSLPTEN